MKIQFSKDFKKSLKKHSEIKKAVKKKVDMVIADPIGLGEPLKGNFRGFYSVPVKKNFIIIFLYCYICRRKNDDDIVLCDDCIEQEDQTLRFILLAPHDEAYRKN